MAKRINWRYSGGNPRCNDCVKKGNIIINPWYGLGTINLFPESDSLENFKSLYLRPMGVSAEYMVTDDIGVGIDFIYNRQGYSATDPNNIDGMGNLVTYNYDVKTERTRIHLRFNYHFTKDEKFDGYLGIGAGTNSRKNSYTSNDPYVTDVLDDTELLPFSMRVCLGGRYFFSENYGLVGENLTIDDLNEKQFFIGDELKIANVVIKITQPRIPCYKLSVKMNVKNFTQQFIDHGYLGIYAKVIKQGQIKKGDNLELIHRENDTMSIYEVSKLVFDKNSNVEQLKKAVEIKYLSEEIKERFINKLAKLGHYEVI